MGRLERHLDVGIIRRVLAGIRYKDEEMTRITKPNRRAGTYRAARRNNKRFMSRVDRPVGGFGWAGVEAKYFPHPPVRENKRDRSED